MINNDYIIDDKYKAREKLARLQRCYSEHLVKSAPPSTKKYCITCEIWIKGLSNPHQRYISRSKNYKKDAELITFDSY